MRIDSNAYRAEFWKLKHADRLQADILDAQRRGDPTAVYQLRHELDQIRSNPAFAAGEFLGQ